MIVKWFTRALCLLVVFLSVGSAAAEECTPQSLAGTWKLVSTVVDGKPVASEPGTTHLMLMTTTHFVSVQYDSAGKITTSEGGTNVVLGNSTRSTAQLRMGEGGGGPMHKELVNTCVLNGNRWTAKGDFRSTGGPLIESVFERVGTTATTPNK